jgi:hypothetical protein
MPGAFKLTGEESRGRVEVRVYTAAAPVPVTAEQVIGSDLRFYGEPVVLRDTRLQTPDRKE